MRRSKTRCPRAGHGRSRADYQLMPSRLSIGHSRNPPLWFHLVVPGGNCG